MSRRTWKLLVLLSLGMATCCFGAAYEAQAFMIDGSSPVVCAFSKAFACDVVSGCEGSTIEDFNLPRFFKVDFKNNKIISLGAAVEGGVRKETPIKSVGRGDGTLVLQGIELRGWTMVISEDSGYMVLTGAGNDEAFVLFGDCIGPER